MSNAALEFENSIIKAAQGRGGANSVIYNFNKYISPLVTGNRSKSEKKLHKKARDTFERLIKNAKGNYLFNDHFVGVDGKTTSYGIINLLPSYDQDVYSVAFSGVGISKKNIYASFNTTGLQITSHFIERFAERCNLTSIDEIYDFFSNEFRQVIASSISLCRLKEVGAANGEFVSIPIRNRGIAIARIFSYEEKVPAGKEFFEFSIYHGREFCDNKNLMGAMNVEDNACYAELATFISFDEMNPEQKLLYKEVERKLSESLLELSEKPIDTVGWYAYLQTLTSDLMKKSMGFECFQVIMHLGFCLAPISSKYHKCPSDFEGSVFSLSKRGEKARMVEEQKRHIRQSQDSALLHN